MQTQRNKTVLSVTSATSNYSSYLSAILQKALDIPITSQVRDAEITELLIIWLKIHMYLHPVAPGLNN